VTTWIIKANDLDLLIAGGIPTPLLHRFLADAKVGYGTTSNPYPDPQIHGGTPYAIYTSWQDPTNGISTDPAFPQPWCKGVIWDMENWSLTPVAEQQRPGFSTRRAMMLCRQHGLDFIPAPGMDLAPVVLAGNGTTDDVNGYCTALLPHDSAILATRINMQVQRYDGTSSTYASALAQCAQQATAAHRSVAVMGGLSTCHGGIAITASQLHACYQATFGKNNVDGYWLNVVTWGNSCPGGNAAAAIGLLQQVYGIS